MEENTQVVDENNHEGEYFDGYTWRKKEDTVVSRGSDTNSDMSYQLSFRELEVLRMMASNMTAKQMAEKLAISHRTIQFHQDSMYWKLGVSGNGAKAQAVEKGRKLGLIK